MHEEDPEAAVAERTEVQRAELTVETGHQRLQDVLMHLPAAISVRAGSELVYTFVNPGYQQLMGNRKLLGRATREALPDTSPETMERLERVIATGEPYSATECPIVQPDEHGIPRKRYCNLTFHPLRDEQGRVDFVLSFTVDVTEQVEARAHAEALAAALKDRHDSYKHFVAHSTEGIWRLDLSDPVPIDLPVEQQIDRFFAVGVLAECNDAFARMYGYERAEMVIGKRLGEFLIPTDPKNRQYLAAFVAAGYRLQGAESEELDCYGARKVFDNGWLGVVEDGKVVRAWGTQRDITAQVEAREQAETASRAKDEFLAMLGHELRNPMAPIMTAIELMKLRGSQHFLRERQVIERQVRHLVRLVDDLLDVSRMTRGNLSIEHASLDLASVLAASVELSSPLLEQYAHELVVHASPGLVVQGDAMRLRQVFSNLLNNAAKYTPRGGRIEIRADHVAHDACVRIRDTGIGIHPDMLARLFEPFVQERQSLERSTGGLGLGLAIVRSLVTLHGGTVEAFSQGPGCGSEFTVRLPLVSGAAKEPLLHPEQHVEHVPALRILVVDDNVDAAVLLGSALEALGHEVLLAHDGPSALRELQGFRPDLALLDLGLPVMDGFELAGHMRAQRDHAGIPLVALTGYGDATMRIAARDAGFDGHLVKPVELALLQNVLAGLKPRGR